MPPSRPRFPTTSSPLPWRRCRMHSGRSWPSSIDAGLTFAEIAAVTGTSLNTAASRYRYALEKLRTALGGREDD